MGGRGGGVGKWEGLQKCASWLSKSRLFGDWSKMYDVRPKKKKIKIKKLLLHQPAGEKKSRRDFWITKTKS